MSDPPPSYASVAQDAFYHHQPVDPHPTNMSTSWQGQSGQTDQYSISQSTSGSQHDPGFFQPQPVAGSNTPSYTYRMVQAAPVPVQGGYQYSASQGMMPVQSGRSLLTTPTMYSGNSARRRYLIVFMLVFCILIFIMTIICVIIFVALRPAPVL